MIRRLVAKFMVRWLRERALVLPEAVREELAKKLRVNPQTIVEVEYACREAIVREVEQLLD
jgi:hypothetical protein